MGGFENILVVTDHFTKYAVAIQIINQTTRTTAEAFYNSFIVHLALNVNHLALNVNHLALNVNHLALNVKNKGNL